MKTPLISSGNLLLISSMGCLLEQIKEGDGDKEALKGQVDALKRSLCALLALNLEAEDEAVRLAAELYLLPMFASMTATKAGDGFPIAKMVKANTRQKEPASAAAFDISKSTIDRILLALRQDEPEIICA